jgi:hypothetical protein
MINSKNIILLTISLLTCILVSAQYYSINGHGVINGQYYSYSYSGYINSNYINSHPQTFSEWQTKRREAKRISEDFLSDCAKRGEEDEIFRKKNADRMIKYTDSVYRHFLEKGLSRKSLVYWKELRNEEIDIEIKRCRVVYRNYRGLPGYTKEDFSKRRRQLLDMKKNKKD